MDSKAGVVALVSTILRLRADNAVYQLARALGKVEAYRFPVMANDLTRAYLGAVAKAKEGEIGAALRRFAQDPNDAAAAETLARNPVFVGTTRTTCVATLLAAGHAENALPQTAKAAVNCRIFPAVPVETVRAAHAYYPGVAVVPYLESGGTDGLVYRTAGIPTFASSGLFAKPSEMYAHGLNERLPVQSFYEGLNHVFRLAVELGGATRAH